jgi:Rrf2 family nitric oxide-sensitive transcriptional repressor
MIEGSRDASSGKSGYLEMCGRSGGIRLMRSPHEINIGHVVRAFEDERGVLGCVKGPGYCRIERVCVLRCAVRDATATFRAVLDEYTLADLMKPQKALASLLERQAASEQAAADIRR